MNAMPYVWASCPCDYRIQNLVRVNPPKIEEQEPKIRGQKMNREEIAQLMNETSGQSFGTEAHFQRFAAALVAAEREACARVVEQYAVAWNDEGYVLAQGIRARGQK
jgi:hypothetical protein